VSRTLAGAAAVVLAWGLAPAVAGGLLPHRADFDLTLASPRGEGGVADVSGRMTIELADACDGWTVDQRLVLDITFEGETAYRSVSSFVSWESKDGTRFRFEDRTWHDSGLIEEISGNATLEAADGAGEAVLTKPGPATLALPVGTLFPTRHTEVLIERARAGEVYLLRPLFDGTSADGPVDVGAAIGKARAVPDMPGAEGDGFAWPMRLAFFLGGEDPDRPSFEIAVLMQGNGVARDMTLDYGDYAVRATLTKVEPSAPPDC
jgi:hypothetical protein